MRSLHHTSKEETLVRQNAHKDFKASVNRLIQIYDIIRDVNTALVNIATVNEYLSDCEYLCCDKLFNALYELESAMDRKDFIALLNDSDRLQEVI